MTNKRGGARVGAGRKTVDGVTIITTIGVSLDAESLALIRSFAPDNDSLGLRLLCKEVIRLRAGSQKSVIRKPVYSDKNPDGTKKALHVIARERRALGID